MNTVTKEFRFEAAHRLMRHSGKCKNLHGHSYKMVVTVCGERDPDTGMVIDFSLLSVAVSNILEDGSFKGKFSIPFDHSLMLHEKDPLLDHLRRLDGIGDMRIIPMVEHPTAEYMAQLLYIMIDAEIEHLFTRTDEAQRLGLRNVNRPVVSWIEIWETAKCYAAYGGSHDRQ